MEECKLILFLVGSTKKGCAKSYAILNFDVTIVCEQPKYAHVLNERVSV
ncbi:hypothetical protein OTSANNIE_0005 [Anaplasma phagocytophilum str. Annie]|nr:hypothetical protein OTSANNIE_0005 [Anaplasma phagocytophilum str. Annie]